MFIFSKTAYSRLRNTVTEEPDSVTDILFSTMPQWAKVMLPDERDDDKLCLVKTLVFDIAILWTCLRDKLTCIFCSSIV